MLSSSMMVKLSASRMITGGWTASEEERMEAVSVMGQRTELVTVTTSFLDAAAPSPRTPPSPTLPPERGVGPGTTPPATATATKEGHGRQSG